MNWAHQEMSGAEVGHAHFRKNSIEILDCLSRHSGLSFSAALGERLRKSAHRLFSKVDIDLQSGHRAQTVLRSKEEAFVLVVEDTTDLNYQAHRSKQGMGQLGGMYDCRGINMHSGLAVSGSGLPLGLVGQYIWAPSSSGRAKSCQHYPIEEKESYKWIYLLRAIEAAYADQGCKVLIVGDREADFYEHLSQERSADIEFLVRGKFLNRKVLLEGQQLRVAQLPQHFPIQGQLEIELLRQGKRPARKAMLSVRYGQFTYPPSSNIGHGKALTLTLVHVKEGNPPEDQTKAIEWYLFTTLEVTELEQALQIIDFYTKRWIVERFHYVLKTGLRIEKLQIDHIDRLANALKVYSIVAWRILHLTYLAKTNPQESAQEVFDKQHIQILEQLSPKPIKKIRDFILALGALVGFRPTKKQPFPGEKLLWQAFSQLRNIQTGWKLAQKQDFRGTG